MASERQKALKRRRRRQRDNPIRYDSNQSGPMTKARKRRLRKMQPKLGFRSLVTREASRPKSNPRRTWSEPDPILPHASIATSADAPFGGSATSHRDDRESRRDFSSPSPALSAGSASIDALVLNGRAPWDAIRTRLKEKGVRTLGELALFPLSRLQDIHGLGPVRIQVLREALQRKGVQAKF